MSDRDQIIEAPDDATKMLPESAYLGAWDLDGKAWVLTIRDVKLAKLANNAVVKKQTGPKMLLYFVGSKKGLLCGAKNTKAVILLYGKSVKKWIGQPVEVYPTTDQGASGGTVDCVRIKPEIPKKKAAAELPNQPMDQDMRRNQMVQAGELPPDDGQGSDDPDAGP